MEFILDAIRAVLYLQVDDSHHNRSRSTIDRRITSSRNIKFRDSNKTEHYRKSKKNENKKPQTRELQIL